MKKLSRIILALSVLSVYFGSCDTTNIRNRGSIDISIENIEVGRPLTLTLQIPQDLQGQVHKAIWVVDPPEAGTLTYKKNNIISEKATEFIEDRSAGFTPLQPGKAVIEVMMFHNKQTSPQLFATKEINIAGSKQ